MFVIHVIPLMRGAHVESLSYFASVDYPIGTFVRVPIRGKSYAAVVTETTPVSSTKTSLKLAHFSLRKLPEQTSVVTLPASLNETARLLSQYYPVGLGTIIYHLLPPEVRSGDRPYPSAGELTHTEEPTPAILTARSDERLTEYKSHVRSVFAHRGSVLLIAPTGADVERIAQSLKTGIAERVVTLSSYIGKRELDRAFKSFEDTTTAKLIVATPAYAYLERADLLSIIIEQAASPLYRTRTKPYLDHRTALTHYARVSGRSLIFGDSAPRTEDEYARREDKALTFGEPTKRIGFPATLTIQKQRDKPTPETPFSLFSPELKKNISTGLEAREHIFLYGARRGLSPVVACQDCGYIFRCPDSNTPYSLLRTYKDHVEERWFVSSTSGSRVRALDTCPTCGSWRLRERGIGIQQVFDECKTQFPNTPILLFDNTTATTPLRSRKIVEKFYSEKGSILVGTSMALPYLDKGVDLAAIMSLDATRTIPTWRADEWVFQFLLRLREMTRREVFVQTRTEPDTMLTYAQRGALERFYDDEILLRQQLNYPPFCTLILATWTGPTSTIKNLDDTIRTVVAPHEPQLYNDPLSTPEKTIRYALMRIPVDSSTQAQLIAKLRGLPPYIKVEVNPDRII